MKRYRANKKAVIIIGTVLEVEIGPKVTTSGMCRTFVISKFDIGGRDMKVANINIRSANIHTPEPLRPDTDREGGDSYFAVTTTPNGDKTITDSVYISVFEVPAPNSLNYEALRVVVPHPMAETPGRRLFPLTESGGSVVGQNLFVLILIVRVGIVILLSPRLLMEIKL